MRTTKYSVIDRVIAYIEQVTITGSENVDTFHFEFDSEWDVFNAKYFLLNVDGTCYIDTLDENNDVVLRSVAYDNKNVTFGVYGINGNSKLSSDIAWIETTPSAFGQIQDVDNLPDKDEWVEYTQEMLGLLAQGQITLEDCQQALTDAQSARDTAQGYMQTTEDYKNTTKQYMDTTEGYKNDVAGLKQDVIDLKNGFDADVTQKTTDFNNNATQKTNDFNNNATQKTTDFNNNATSKTTDFNDNATSKTGTFNDNVTQKTTSFNENYTEKLGDITTAEETAVGNIEDAEDEAIEHIQAQGSSYENRIQLLEDNFDTSTSPNSNNYVIEDSASGYNRGNIKIGDGPELEQGENPSPDNPQDITVVEGESDINISNANLFDKNSTNFFKTYIGQTSHAISTVGDSNNFRTYYMECLPNTTYYLKKFDVESLIIAGTCPTTPVKGTVLNDYSIANASTHKLSILTSSNAKYLVFQVYNASSGYTLDEELNSFYMGKTDVEPTKYVPHKGQTYPITLPEGMFLGAMGEASNYIYGTKDNWKSHNDIVKNRGSINVTAVDTQEDYTIALVSKYNIGLPTGKYTNYAKFDKFKEVDSSNDYQVGKFNTSINKDIIYFCIPATITTVADAKAYLDGLNMTRYIITTRWAEDTDITDQTLISQLNNIADNLQTYKDQTIVFNSSDNLAPNIQFKYAQNPLANVNSEISDIKNAILSLGGEV